MISKRPYRLAAVGLAAAGLAALLGALPLRADIDTGIFLLQTSPLVPAQLQVYLQPGFFDTGSDEVILQDLNLHGVPLATQQGTPSLAPADTVIQLLSAVDFPNQPAQRTVSARVVAINLATTVPLMVTYNGGSPEPWDVRVCYADVAGPDSRISFINQCDTAGTFIAGLAIRPKFVFTRQRDGRQVSLNQDGAAIATFTAQGYWINRSFSSANFFEVPAGAVIDANCDGNFGTTLPATADAILGLQRVNCNPLYPNQGYQEIQPVYLTEHYALEPATRDDKVLPLHESAFPGPGSGSGHEGRAALELGSMAVLGAAAVVIRPRRRRAP